MRGPIKNRVLYLLLVLMMSSLCLGCSKDTDTNEDQPVTENDKQEVEFIPMYKEFYVEDDGKGGLPHLHLDILMITEDNKLSAKTLITRDFITSMHRISLKIKPNWKGRTEKRLMR